MGYTPHVLVVGGDPVGAGIARDFAVRGLDVTLVEPGPVAGGATGRMQGLLASGAQCADTDPDLARQCLEENRRLSEIASHCIEDTGGLVVAESDDQFQRLQAACEDCGMTATERSGEEARDREPALAEDVERALQVPDAVVDPFQLTHALVRDAREYDAEIRPRTTVTDIHVENGAVEAVTLRHDPLPSMVEAADDDEADDESDGETADGDESSDEGEDEQADDESGEADSETADGGGGRESDGDGQVRSDGGSKQVPGTTGIKPGAAVAEHLTGGNETGESSRPEVTVEEIEVDYVVNAAGGRAAEVCARAGLSLPVETEHQRAVVTSGRLVERPVSRAGDDARVVPFGQHTACAASVTGQTDGSRPGAVDSVLDTAGALVPAAPESRAMRSIERVRHVIPGQVPGGHAFALVDHGDQQDCWGLLTVLGGSVTTHRLVAERVCDDVCQEFGIRRVCQTDELVLPGSEDVPDLAEAVGTFGLAESVYEQSKDRLGSRASVVLHSDDANPVVCECQSVSRTEVRDALADGATADADLDGVRTRTSATMGPCQGGRCAHRLAAELHPDHPIDVVDGALTDLLDERWAGQRAVARGRQLREMACNYRLHAATMNRKYETDIDIAEFDDGRPPGTQTPRHCSRAGAESLFVADDTLPGDAGSQAGDDHEWSQSWGQQWGWTDE